MNDISALQDKYNKLHDMILVGEQEVVNLKRAKIAQQSEIQRLIKEKQQLEEQCEQYDVSIDERKQDIDKMNKVYQETTQKLSDQRTKLETLTTEEVNLTSLISELNDTLKELEKSKISKRKELDNVSKDLEKEQTVLKTFIEGAKDLFPTIVFIVVPLVLLGLVTIETVQIAQTNYGF